MTTQPELMTIGDLAKRTQLSESFWYARIADGSLPHYRMGKAGIRVSEEQYRRYLQGKERGGAATSPPAKPRVSKVTLKHLA